MKRALTHVSALAVAAGMAVPALAQNGDDQQMQSGSQTAAEQSASGTENTAGATGTEAPASVPAMPEADAQEDRLVATVGKGEIRQSDVLAAIESLPPDVRQTSPDTLLPAVVDQLVMRHLIVDQARAEGLESDPKVQELAGSDGDTTMDQALLAVWLKRELDERVTDADVDEAVDKMAAQNPDMGDTAAIEPQVRQALQMQAINDIGNALRKDVEITFYGPDGEPIEATEQVGSGSEGESATGAEQQD